MRTIIVEDEVLAIKHLQQILNKMDNITVVAVLESIAETIDWFEKNPQPDLVFMDIHLADGLSFEIFNHVSIDCPIIFTTAYDEYALKAFKVNSIDYLLKPIETADVHNALQKLNNLASKDALQTSINSLIKAFRTTSKYKTHFLIPLKGDKLIPVKTADLTCFYIDTSSVKAIDFDGRTYRFDYNLEELTEMLDPEDFFRANRQFIISRKAIRDIDLWFNNRLSINLVVEIPVKILISKARVSEFKTWYGA